MVATVFGFLVGSINPAMIIARTRNGDLRQGTGNPGVTSLGRVLGLIFEADFKPVSYGFRPGRRAHDAIVEIHGSPVMNVGGFLCDTGGSGLSVRR